MREKVLTSAPLPDGPGWFGIPGVQSGRRSLEEQMLGLAPALAEAKGKSVCDLGCAEGLIAIEFAKAGARGVWACDFNAPMIATARGLVKQAPDPDGVVFEHADLSRMIAGRTRFTAPFDIVLALAIVHKLEDPRTGVDYVADICCGLAVFRLPLGSDGSHVAAKHNGKACNLNLAMAARGFNLERIERGPRKEMVQYWRRKA